MYKAGDIVETIDDSLRGKIVSLKDKTAIILLEDGFEMEVLQNELIRIDDPSILNISNFEAAQAANEKESTKKKKQPKVKPKERSAAKMEVDLHIHQLTPSSKNMSNFDMLNLQLETAKRQLDFAIRNRIQKVVFIHGVGEGVLRTELEYLFKKYERIDYYDADFKKYGFGATEVYIYQKA
ncbi:DNA mismatch repair protein MutS [Leptobacterium flavescens]|uniref:DNA mismatch repair protein MutS n=1 Tax=Leptobacterium flavescens TaxID=472055 RepID=A0A6P0UNV9_9FLAO|nr:Smr/MutS family protein [Leptobacterium flavescens]NER14182.1 DNA mismatch repair protein MutS [Leptobacterium flavescens]